jgi:hypothetical protein
MNLNMNIHEITGTEIGYWNWNELSEFVNFRDYSGAVGIAPELWYPADRYHAVPSNPRPSGWESDILLNSFICYVTTGCNNREVSHDNDNEHGINSFFK